MGRKISLVLGLFLIACGINGCGSEGFTAVVGPILDINEAKSLVVDHLFINGGLDDEFSSQGEYAVYLRDTGTGQDMACAGASDGFNQLKTPGTYYADLDIALRAVSGTRPDSAARFQVVVVEKDSEDCPKGIQGDDDIVGTSAELQFDALIGKRVWTTNGLSAVTLRSQADTENTVSAMAPATTIGLFLDKLYFNNGSDDSSQNRYFIFAEKIENGASVAQCQVSDSDMQRIQFGHLLYAALGIGFGDCLPTTDASFAKMTYKVSLWIQKSKGPQLVGETATTTIGDLIGERHSFTNDRGYISFQSVNTTPFAASVVRLADVTKLVATTLSYIRQPSFNGRVELHIFGDGDSFSLACSGTDQGLTGVGSPGSVSNLSAALVASTGQKELFGASKVTVQLVDRTDGKKCPEPFESNPTILGKSASLPPSSLPGNGISFSNGDGSTTLNTR